MLHRIAERNAPQWRRAHYVGGAPNVPSISAAWLVHEQVKRMQQVAFARMSQLRRGKDTRKDRGNLILDSKPQTSEILHPKP